MRLRQVALVARDLDPVVDDLCAVLGIAVGFRDPDVSTFGLRNAVMPIGDTFLEVVSPMQPNTTAGRYLERFGGDGGYMVILQCDDLDADRRRVRDLGVRIVWSIDLADARGTHLHPKDVGGAILSLDDMTPPESWRWAGPDWQAAVHTDVVSEITGVELQSPRPEALAERWAQVLGRQVSQTKAGAIRIVLEQGVICFAPDSDGRGERVSGITVHAVDRDRLIAAARARALPVGHDDVTICGVHVRFVG